MLVCPPATINSRSIRTRPLRHKQTEEGAQSQNRYQVSVDLEVTMAALLNLSDVTAGGKAINQTEEDRLERSKVQL